MRSFSENPDSGPVIKANIFEGVASNSPNNLFASVSNTNKSFVV